MKTRLFNALLSAVLIGAPVAANFASMATPVMAAGIELGGQAEGGTLAPTEGIVDLQGGTESTITIHPSSTQELKSRKFKVYALFSIEKVAGADGFKYTYNTDLKEKIQQVLWGDDNGEALKTFLQDDRKMAEDKLPASSADVNEQMAVAYLSHIAGNLEASGNVAAIDSTYRKTMDKLAKAFEGTANAYTLDITNVKENGDVELQHAPMAFYMFSEVYDGNKGENKATSLIMVNNVAENEEFTAKDELPEIDKKLLEATQDVDAKRVGTVYTDTKSEANDYEANETIKFETTFKVPSNYIAYEKYKVIINDTMEQGLDLDTASVVVKINGAAGASYTLQTAPAGSDYTLDTTGSDGTTFKVTIDDVKAILTAQEATFTDGGPYTIVVEYTGHLNPEKIKDIADLSATVGGAGFQNKVHAQFSNHPDSTVETDEDLGKTPDNTTLVYTFNMDVKKIDGTTTNNVAGAKFKLYKSAECNPEDEIKLTAAGDGLTYYVDPNGTDTLESAAGDSVTIIGLDEGDYWLKETEAPTGYAPLTSPIKVSINPTYDTLDDGVDIQTKESGVLNKLESVGEYTDYWGANKNDAMSGADATKAYAGEVVIANEKPDKLASTGSNTALILTVVGLGLLGGALVIGYKSKKETQ